MTQLNLLPDVKLEYIRAERSRRMTVSIALLISAAAIVLLVLLLGAAGLQKKHLNDLSRDIKSDTAALQQKPQVNKILTVQNQLASLTSLHDAKPAASRLFDYLNQITPAQVDITNFKVDFTQQKATITGAADALSSVNKYIDTLKFTTYKTAGSSKAQPAFKNVVLTSFGLGSAAQANGHTADYVIDLSYDPNIFDITQKVNLTIPSQITTRSGLDQPADLFQPDATPSKAPTAPTGGGN